MGEVSGAVEVIRSQLAVLQDAAGGLSHRELVGLLSELTALAWALPAVEYRLLNRLVNETEPHRLGESSWTKVLSTALRVSDKDARRRLREAKHLCPRRGLSGEALPPVWEATAAAELLMMIDQDGPEPSESEQAHHRGITLGKQQRDGTRSIRGRLDAETGAYWEAILAKKAAPGMCHPDHENTPPTARPPTARISVGAAIPAPRPSATTTRSKPSAAPP